MTPAPSYPSQLSTVRWGQSRKDISLPVHFTSSIPNVLETDPNWEFAVGCPIEYPSILGKFLSWFWIDKIGKYLPHPLFLANLQTTRAFCTPWKSSQTGSPPTKMFPSWGPDPPTSFTSEVLNQGQLNLKINHWQGLSHLECSSQHYILPGSRNLGSYLVHRHGLGRTLHRGHSLPFGLDKVWRLCSNPNQHLFQFLRTHPCFKVIGFDTKM